MSQAVNICTISENLKAKVKKFRFRKEKNIAAITAVINPDELIVDVEEEHEDITIEELQDELPAHLPRFVFVSYVLKHSDGRESYPLVFIFVSPQGTKPELQMLYAGTKTELVKATEATKVFEVRSTEELTTEWLESRLIR